ncbi:hypothetical protein RN87_01090 [Fusobacterium hwasookii ChDC F174]|uniref:Uncharacterized protein n=1 Tax=Fusobacterium hwasookii ChDC F174 TaxID=1307442 RepID=A0A0S2ZJW6_9FUSO|nr:hypothetical protein [Fusobacterium hwasookii]ALQ39195.1 hypothetical protein RN87_01090 [Fusobacterium hwasookii ChDC F174]
MSRSYEYSYQLEAERRRQIYLNRIAATTEEFYRRYEQQYREMLSHGLSAYIPSEMSRLESDLARIRDLLVYDPESARDISFEIGSYIRTMLSLATEAREEFDRSERMRVATLRAEREQQQSELMNEYFKILQTITNPIIVNYSISKMQELRKDIENGKLSSSTKLKEISASIISEAEKKASDWKENTVKKHYQKNVAQAINEAESRLKSEKIENQEKTQEFLNKINTLRSALESGAIDSNTIEKKVVELENEVDETLISEETRREIVISIIKQLQKQEFTVEKTQLVKTDGKNYVKIVAKQPSGKRAICNIDLCGKIAYKFDNYAGMTCLKDIEKFNVDLEKVYSIKLSDERVLWENPDKLLMDANTLPTNEGRKA